MQQCGAGERGSGGYNAALAAELAGPDGVVVSVDIAALAAQLEGLIGVWDRHHRHGPGPSITVYPVATAMPAADGLRLLVPRRHTTTAITWPATFLAEETP